MTVAQRSCIIGEMTPDRRFSIVQAPSTLFRVGFHLDVSQLAAWQYQHGAGRWDDARIAHMREIIAHAYADENESDDLFASVMLRKAEAAPTHRLHRVLSTSTSEVGAFIEVLQDFRSPTSSLTAQVLAEYDDIVDDAPDLLSVPLPARGIVPYDLVQRLCVGRIQVEFSAPLVDVEGFETLHTLRRLLLDEARVCGFSDVDRSVVLSKNRRLTQHIAALIYSDPRRFAGITHGSVLGLPYQNWAFFETVDGFELRSGLRGLDGRRVQIDDPSLQSAVTLLDLQIEGARDLANVVQQQMDALEEMPPSGDELQI